MNEKTLLKKLKKWIKSSKAIEKENGEEIIVFEDKEVFELFEDVLNPFDNYTYKYLLYFFIRLEEHLEEGRSIEEFKENIEQYVELEVDMYNSDLLKWLSSNLYNVEYLEEAENVGFRGYEAISYAQFLYIESIFYRAIEIIEKLLEGG